jgi:hypothetical protein
VKRTDFPEMPGFINFNPTHGRLQIHSLIAQVDRMIPP